MLVRVMLVAIDIVLSGEPLALETARDLIREVKHANPELAAEWNRFRSADLRGVISLPVSG
jgi:hypothetical protein